MGDWFTAYYKPEPEVDIHQLDMDSWDEDFRTATGEYPPFSRLFPIFQTHGIHEIGTENRNWRVPPG